MEYTNLWYPLMLIATCLVIGLGMGAFIMRLKLNKDINLLEIDLSVAHERLRELLGQYNNVRSKKDKVKPTKLDNTFKAELQLKDDTIDRLNDLREQDQGIIKALNNEGAVAASQILLLEARISKNKKVAIEREEELKSALDRINNQLDIIAELESESKTNTFKEKDTNSEIQELSVAVKARDMSIERKDKRIQELESVIEEYEGDDGKRLGGGVGNWKRI